MKVYNLENIKSAAELKQMSYLLLVDYQYYTL